MNEEEHIAAFKAALRGVGANHVAAAFNTITPGINWMGCSKTVMAAEYARFKVGKLNSSGRYSDSMPTSVIDLELLSRRARTRASGQYNWHKITNP